MSNPLKIGLIGFGNIGTGVVRHLQEYGELVNSRLPRPMELRAICDIDISRDRGLPTDGYILTSDYEDLTRDPEIDVIIELIGGTTIARQVVLEALNAGKHVVTANKALIATYCGEIFEAAEQNNVHVLFEASVGAGIPCIRSLQTGLVCNRFNQLQGILNGTCNYILTVMEDNPGTTFHPILQEAMRLGYAEPDPTLDIEGIDTAHKIAIMGSLILGQDLRIDDVTVLGISRITPEDFQFAKSKNQTIKLLACASPGSGDNAELSVWPTLIPDDHLLGRVRGVTNTVWVDADPIGPTMYTGAGAGQGSTSSGILSDIALIAQAGDNKTLSQLNPIRVCSPRKSEKPQIRHPKRYMRVIADDKAALKESLGYVVLSEDATGVSFVAPEQSEEERKAMYEKLGSMGIVETAVSEIRAALQDKDDILVK